MPPCSLVGHNSAGKPVTYSLAIDASKNIRVTKGKVALHVASCSNRILFDRQPLIHIEPKSPVGSHVRLDKRGSVHVDLLGDVVATMGSGWSALRSSAEALWRPLFPAALGPKSNRQNLLHICHKYSNYEKCQTCSVI